MLKKNLSSAESRAIMEAWNGNARPVENLDESEKILREELLRLYEEGVVEASQKSIDDKSNKYYKDLYFGMNLYEFFIEQKRFTLRTASDSDMWKSLSIRIVPDLVAKRWGAENYERFFKRESRIWLKSLWWYVHLSWQGSRDVTEKVLKDNTTDEIMNLVERSGYDGYRVNVSRVLMKKYSEVEKDTNRYTFRRALKLNTARSMVLEPELHVDGIEGYVEELFQDVLDGTKQSIIA